MSSDIPADRSAHWSCYWAGGSLTSLPQDFSGNYDGEIAEFWHAQCEPLADGSTVIDVCTGNGAVAMLVANSASRLNRQWQIIGVDAAAIDAQRIRRLHRGQSGADRVQFVGDQPFEQFALDPGSVDLMVSQYGIEYCHWRLAAERAFELLKPEGRLAMITHAPDSDMLMTMRVEAGEYERIERLKLLAAFNAWLEGRIGPDRLAKVVREARKIVGRAMRHNPSPLYRYVMEMLEGLWQVGPDNFHRYRAPVQTFHDQLSAGHGRLKDMLRVNEAMIADPGWTRVFESAGLQLLDQGELQYRQRHRIGHFRIFAKPAD